MYLLGKFIGMIALFGFIGVMVYRNYKNDRK